jgi:NTE family protein
LDVEFMPREARDNPWVAMISRVAPFSFLAANELVEIADCFTWFTALGGKTIVQQGDPSDALYIVVSGALGVYSRDSDGQERFFGRIGPGETVGEMGLISGEPRSATVRCLRDAELLAIAKNEWDAFTEKHPGAFRAITQTLISRLRTARSETRPPDRSLAIIPHGADVDGVDFAGRLVCSLATWHSAVCLTRDMAAGHGLDWFRELEANHDLVVYLADPEPTPWTRQCLRRADSLLLVARGERPATAFEALRFDITPESIQPMDIALIWDEGAPIKGTSAWLALHDFRMHHHLRGAADIGRLARMITRNAIGLVLAGGGARGVAHYGVIWALRDHQVPIDIVGGTSIGAIVAAMAAAEWSRDKMERCYDDSLSGRGLLTDFTLPVVALLAGRRLDVWLEHWFGGLAIEDLPLPFFGLSTNLTLGGSAVHVRGPLSKWLRASISIPGILPPVIHEGQIFVDGGVINNLPVDVMHRIGRGPVIAVDIQSDTPFTAAEISRSNWFPYRGAPRRPGILELLWRVATINSAASHGSARFASDILLRPDIGSIGLLNWKGLRSSMIRSYDYTVANMEEIKAKLLARSPTRNP